MSDTLSLGCLHYMIAENEKYHSTLCFRPDESVLTNYNIFFLYWIKYRNKYVALRMFSLKGSQFNLGITEKSDV